MSRQTNFDPTSICTKPEKRQPRKLLQIIAPKENLVTPDGEDNTRDTFTKGSKLFFINIIIQG